jgi:hypothetical protein
VLGPLISKDYRQLSGAAPCNGGLALIGDGGELTLLQDGTCVPFTKVTQTFY